MKDLAIRDFLTGIYNRRFFMTSLEKEFYRSRRYETPMSLIILDLDDFKEINDRHGHQHGDQVLVTVAGVIRRESRDSDIPARFGGEEFVVLAPETEIDQGMELAKRLREKVAESGITASFGLTAFPNGRSRFPDDLIRQADEALYEAKRKGKNQVVSAAGELTEADNVTGE
jgi:diguanylate cyclase (GGDEF)-like protein